MIIDNFNPRALKSLDINQETKKNQFENINFLVSCFRFIGSTVIINIVLSAVIVFRRQILKSIDVRIWRLKPILALTWLSLSMVTKQYLVSMYNYRKNILYYYNVSIYSSGE